MHLTLIDDANDIHLEIGGSPFDVTGTVNVLSAGEVARAVCEELEMVFPGIRTDILDEAFHVAERLYSGREFGFLPCDTPYHDLRHATSAALTCSRLIAGVNKNPFRLTMDWRQAETAVILSLFHDGGFIRRESEAHLCGASLTSVHVSRSVDLAAEYMLSTPELCEFANMAELIHFTGYEKPIEWLNASWHGHNRQIGHLVATADLLCQVADREYLEKCRDHLYQEFVDGGLAGPLSQADSVCLSAEELLEKTPAFYDEIILKRLTSDLSDLRSDMSLRFPDHDPYESAINKNLAFVNQIIRDRAFHLLKRKPVTLSIVGS